MSRADYVTYLRMANDVNACYSMALNSLTEAKKLQQPAVEGIMKEFCDKLNNLNVACSEIIGFIYNNIPVEHAVLDDMVSYNYKNMRTDEVYAHKHVPTTTSYKTEDKNDG